MIRVPAHADIGVDSGIGLSQFGGLAVGGWQERLTVFR